MLLRKVNQFSRDAALCRLMSGFGVTVVIQGDACPATTGKVIVLPPLKLDADEIDVAIHDFGVGHEPSHITEGSFEVKTPGFLGNVHNWLEDIRCENSQEVTKYPGLRRERAGFYSEFKKYADRLGTGKLIERAAGGKETVQGALCLFLLEARCSQLGVTHDVKPAPEVERFYRTTLRKFQPRAEAAVDAKATLALAREMHKAIHGDMESLLAALDAAGEAVKKPKGGGRSPFSGEPEDKPETPEDVERQLEDDEDVKTLSDDIFETLVGDGRGVTPRLLNKAEVCPNAAHEPMVRAHLAEGIKMLGTAGATMTRLLVANSRPRTVRGRLDGRLDCRAVTEDHLDVRRNLYTRRIRGAADKAAVSFLIDVSGSMSHRKSDVTIFRVVLGLVHYLERARVPTEVAGFNYHYWPLKDWDEPMKGKAFLRMMPFHDGVTSLDGAMRMASRTLMARPERRKVLFVLSDGAAGNLEYCKRLSNAMRKDGAVVVGIGLECELRGIFGRDSINLPASNTGGYLVKRLTEILSRKDAA